MVFSVSSFSLRAGRISALVSSGFPTLRLFADSPAVSLSSPFRLFRAIGEEEDLVSSWGEDFGFREFVKFPGVAKSLIRSRLVIFNRESLPVVRSNYESERVGTDLSSTKDSEISLKKILLNRPTKYINANF